MRVLPNLEHPSWSAVSLSGTYNFMCWLPVLDDKPLKDRGDVFSVFMFPGLTSVLSNIHLVLGREDRRQAGRECAEVT